MKASKIELYIRTIDELRSVSLAAERLGISQPALSSFLKKTERELGTPVVDSTKIPVQLTEAGRALLEYEAEVAHLRRNLDRKIADIETLGSSELLVGGATSFNMTYYPAAIAKFTQLYPNANITIVDDTAPNLASRAVSGELDLYLTPSVGEVEGLVCEELIRERILLCIPSQWDIIQKLPKPTKEGFAFLGPKEIELLSDCTYISLYPHQQMGSKLQLFFDSYGIHPSRIVYAEQTVTSLALTSAGVGISLATAATIKHCRFGSSPALFSVDSDFLERMLYIARSKDALETRISRAFIEVLRDLYND